MSGWEPDEVPHASARELRTRFNWQVGPAVSVRTKSCGAVVVGWRDNGSARGKGSGDGPTRRENSPTLFPFLYVFLFLLSLFFFSIFNLKLFILNSNSCFEF
jgi:hypothetical protein